ncbi:MAG TPA: PilZ domain-containing protein [Candidatus Angelobacter sp.]
MSTLLSPALSGKIVARTASVHIDPACNTFLHDCFKPFGIQVVPLAGDPVASLQRQKFEACLLRLYDPDAEAILTAARNSNSNRHLVIYGVARNAKEALRYANYGINAVFDEPLERSSVLKMVRATRPLVINELRRYARVPVVSEALVETNNGRAVATTVEVSSGGLSVRSRTPLASLEPVRVTLSLPGLSPLSLRAFICWARTAEKVYGLRFDPVDERRGKVRGWIDQFLETV